MALSLEVKNYMESYKEALEKELSYVISNNWSVEEFMYKRSIQEKRQRTLTSRNLEKLKHFAKISLDYRNFKTVKNFIDVLVRFVDLYVERYNYCQTLYDWTTYEESGKYVTEEELQKAIDEHVVLKAYDGFLFLVIVM